MKEDGMDQQLTCELNLALIPEKELANRCISFSKQMAGQYRPVIQLSGVTPRVAFAPHITLYQVPIPVQDLPEMQAALLEIAANTETFSLEATEFGANADEGSFEVRYDAPSRLMELQDDTIAAVNPLRGSLLLERDPAGRPLSERIDESGTAGDNIRRTGFDAAGDPAEGGLFHPHVTLNWFEPGTSVEMNGADWPPLSQFNGSFVALGIFVLGPCGTCAQRLRALTLAA
jgi:2'-5' RNA ligase